MEDNVGFFSNIFDELSTLTKSYYKDWKIISNALQNLFLKESKFDGHA